MSTNAVISLFTLLAITLENPVWLLGNLICERSIGMIAGPRGCGKTFLVMLIAYAIAAKKKIFPWGCGAGAPILYLDGEMRLYSFQERFQLIHAKNSEPDSIQQFGKMFQIISRDYSSDPIGSIDTTEGQAQIEKLIPPETKLLIIDNLSSCTSGGSENSTAWAATKTWLIKLRQQKKLAVLLIHHAGKNGTQRGSSAHEDLLDYSILLGALPSSNDRDDTRFSIEHTKLREYFPELRKKYECSIWTEDGVLKHEIVPMATPITEVAAEIIRLSEQGLKQGEIAIRLGVNKSTVSRHLGAAKKKADGEEGKAKSSDAEPDAS